MVEETESAPTRRVRRRRVVSPTGPWRDVATALVPVLACFLGGATEKWAEGIAVILIGGLLLVAPPRVSLGLSMNLILLALLACAATAFLPAAWFFHPAWREALVTDFGIKLPATVSPQPWVTAGALASLVAGLSWFYYVATQQLENRSVRRQFRVFAGAVVILAGLCVAFYFAKTALPFWHNQRGFGPFPNRNQTANLFGIASVLVLACGHDDLRQGKTRWIFWLGGLALLITAIVLNFSRAGIGILVGASAIWVAALALRSRSAGPIAIGISALLGLLTVILIFGGETLERFNLRAAEGTGMSRDFRWLIFQDAIQLIRASPWCGIGLGNFEPVFAIFRDASLGQSRALHPESDWFWICVELGIPAVVLVLLATALLIRRVFPLVEGTAQRIRLAALVAALFFVLHAAVDVSGHRVGSALAGLFIFGLALRRPNEERNSTWLPFVFRAVGLALFGIGALWVIASYRETSLPGSLGVDNERRLAKSANVGRQFNETIARADRGLTWAPLDWQLYFLRALGKAGAQRLVGEAVEDFRRARFLEPNSFEVPFQEGVAWITKQPMLTMTAWREALRRAGPQRPELFNRMLSDASQRNRAVERMLEEFGSVQPDLALAHLARVQGENFSIALNRLLTHDPALGTLTPEQKAKLFQLWHERGDLAALAQFIEKHPELLELAWRGVAEFHAARKDFRQAYELAQRFSTRPTLPPVSGAGSLEELQNNSAVNPNNFALGFALHHAQKQAGRADDALLTIRRFTAQAGCPPYFHFIEAEDWQVKEEWDRAWQAWTKFDAVRSQ